MPLYEQYNLPEEYQDSLLACLVSYPEKFMPYAGIFNAAYFTGVQRIATARALFKYWRKYSQFPGWSVLSQVVYDAIARTAEEKDKETINDFIKKLRELDTGDVESVAEHAVGWAQRRALYLAIEHAAAKFQEGDIPADGFISWFEEALKVGTQKGDLGRSIRHISVADIVADDGSEPPALVEGMLPIGGLGVLAGRAKSFKSWTAMELALAVASGTEWLGFKVAQRPAIYLNFELSDKTLKKRFKDIADAKQIDLAHKTDPEAKETDPRDVSKFLFPLTQDTSRIQVSGKDGDHENRFTEAVCAEVKLAMRQLKISGALIIFDSFYNLSGNANENDASQVKTIYRHLRTLLADTQSTGLVIHHFAKGDPSGKMEGERAAGSRVHRQEPDAYIELVPHREERAVVMTCDLRNYQGIDKQCFRFDFPLLMPAPSLDPSEIKKPQGVLETYTDQEMIEMLVEGPMDATEWKKAVMETTGMSSTT